MNAIFNFLSSPLKQPAERPPPSSMPLTASRPSLSPREQRLAKRAADRFSEPAGRSPRSRLSNVSLASTDHDNTAEISVVSRRRETVAMAPPLSVKKKRISTSTRSSPIHKPSKSNGSRVASSPAVRSSPRGRESAEGSPASIPKRVSHIASSPAVRSSPRTRESVGGLTALASSPASVPKRVSRVASSPAVRSSPRTRESAELGTPASIPASRSSENKSPRKSSRASRATRPQKNGTEKTLEEQPEEAHFEEEVEDDREYEFVRIADHRWVKDEKENMIELLIQWKDGENSWVSEELLHTDNRQALFAYWRSQPGGRPKNPEDDDVYQVFAIRKHRVRNGVPQVMVEWLGYDTPENTWEDQDSIEEAAPKLVDAYFDQVKGKAKIPAKTKSQTKSQPKSKAKPKAPAKTKASAPAKTKAQAKTPARGVTRSSARVSKR
ncbi:chromo domain-containing protein [Fusarium pseudoanthophilum]|uniref:Chromo domain-containing protein n=1 Tax=Fusarium pseudoanthophilum TaxID=48495 RepID=A0A8H5KP62_9HYPO|nr:chromo domain-containing protein [Fusarium pseudoanthophilum]